MKMCVTGLIDQEQTELYSKIEKLNNKGFPSTCVQQTRGERRDIREKRTWKMRDRTRGKEEETGRKEEKRGETETVDWTRETGTPAVI